MSGFLSWLSNIAPADDSPTPPAPRTVTRPDLPPPDASEPEDQLVELTDDNPALTLDEIYTTIDYTDARGTQTRRRITMLNLTLGPKAPILSAICHERRRFRQFRTDRIECFIDDNGEVTETIDFFADTLGVHLPADAPDDGWSQDAGSTGTSPQIVMKWPTQPPVQQLQDRLRPAIALLVTASRSDVMRDVEVDAIMAYIEEEAFSDSPHGQFTSIAMDDIAALEPTIRKMRPRRSSIPNYLKSLEDLGGVHVDRFDRALRRVLHADGKISPEEIEFYSLIEEWRAETIG